MDITYPYRTSNVEQWVYKTHLVLTPATSTLRCCAHFMLKALSGSWSTHYVLLGELYGVLQALWYWDQSQEYLPNFTLLTTTLALIFQSCGIPYNALPSSPTLITCILFCFPNFGIPSMNVQHSSLSCQIWLEFTDINQTGLEPSQHSH